MYLRFCVVLALASACNPWTEDAAVPVTDRPNQEGWDSEAILSSQGNRTAHIRYRHLMKWDKRQMSTFNEGVIMDFFEDGNHSGQLTADSGIIYASTKNVAAFGNVIIVSDSGLAMRTEQVEWNESKQRLFAEGRVMLTTAEDTLYGFEFESNRDLTHWKMKSASGLTSREVDLRTGTVRKRSDALDKEVESVMKEDK